MRPACYISAQQLQYPYISLSSSLSARLIQSLVLVQSSSIRPVLQHRFLCNQSLLQYLNILRSSIHTQQNPSILSSMDLIAVAMTTGSLALSPMGLPETVQKSFLAQRGMRDIRP